MKNSLRIHGSRLNREDECYFYRNRVFSGYVYRFSRDGVLDEILVIKNGIEADVSHDLLITEGELPHIDENGVSIEVGPTGAALCRYKGKEQACIVYEFDEEGILIGETQYNTEDGAYRTWYKNGQMQEYYLSAGDAQAWYENGNYRYREFRDCRIGYEPDGSVNEIRLTGHSQDDMDFSFLASLQYTDSLTLGGAGLDDKVFSSIAGECQKVVENYEFNSTSLSETILLEADFSRAKRILFKNNLFLLPYVARIIKQHHPLCQIVYNGEELPSIRTRINGERVKFENGLYRQGPQVVNGVIYDFDEQGKLLGLKEVEQGRLVNILDPNTSEELLLPGEPVLRMGSRYLAVDREHSNEKAERFLLQGQPYIGVTYFFDGNGLLLEEVHYNPEKAEFRSYYPSGWLKESVDSDGLQSWFENGQIHEEAFGPEAAIYYNDNGTIYKIVNTTEDPAPFKVMGVIPGKELVFSGIGIDNKVIDQFLENEQLKFLSKLTIKNANVTDDALDIKRIGQLESLDLLNNDLISEDAVEYFQRKHPSCRVNFQQV